MFAMTARVDAPAEEMKIVECDPPRLLAVTASTPGGQWHLRVALTEDDGRTLLTSRSRRRLERGGERRSWLGVYLDRLIAAETGGDVAAIDFERDYYPAMAAHYRAELAPPGG